MFSKQLGTLLGTVHLQFGDHAKPATRRVPTALKEKYKEELDRLEKLGVLAKVDEPTVQSRTQSNACSRVRLALALGKRNELRMISYALT